jgi:CBS domain-containing protein
MGSARDVMCTSSPTIAPTDSLARASELMRAFEVRDLPVVDDGCVIGMLTRSDLEPHVGRFEWTPVRVAMTSPVRYLPPDASVGEVADAMLDGRFNAVPVVENGRLAGMIRRHDMLRLLRGR